MKQCRDRVQLEARRLAGYQLLQTGVPPSEVARLQGVTPAAVSKWKKQAARRGITGLKSKGPTGPKSRLTAVPRRGLERALLQGAVTHGWDNDLWTLPRVAQLLQRRWGLVYHPGHVSRLLHALGFSCQKPEGRAREQSADAVRCWRRDVWPVLKKSPC